MPQPPDHAHEPSHLRDVVPCTDIGLRDDVEKPNRQSHEMTRRATDAVNKFKEARDAGDVAALSLGLSTPDGDQFGNLGCNHRHRVFRRVKAASRSKHRADIAERCVRCAMHDGNETVTL